MAIGKINYVKWIVAGGLSLVLVLAILLILFRVAAVEFGGKAALNLLGFKDVTLNIDYVTMRDIHVSELSLGRALQIQDISARYRFPQILAGQIDDVVIGNVAADLSRPQEGAISKILELARPSGEQGSSGTVSNLPSITLKEGQIFADAEGRTLRADVQFSLNSDLRLDGTAHADGTLETAAGPVMLEGLDVSYRANIGESTAGFTLEGGILRHGANVPEWAPLRLTGTGTLSDNKAKIDMDVQTEAKASLARLDGQFDLTAKTGKAAVNIQSLVFDRKALQPHDLFRYAENAPAFDGTLTAAAVISLDGPTVSYNMDIELSGVAMEQKEARITTEKLPLNVTGTYLLDTSEQRARITVPEMTLNLAYGDRRYRVNNLKAEASVLNFGEEIALENLSAAVIEGGKAGSASAANDLSAIVKASAGFNRNAMHGLQLGSALAEISNASYSWDGIIIRNAGLKIKAEGAESGNISGTVTGKVSEVTLNAQKMAVPAIDGEFQVSPEQENSGLAMSLELKSLQVTPLDGAYFKENLTATGSARLEKGAADFKAAVSSKKLGQFITAEGQHSLEIDAGAAHFNMAKLSFEKGGLQPSDLLSNMDPKTVVTGQLEPVGDINWSPPALTATARVKLENIAIKSESGSISGLKGVIEIDNLFPLTIAKTQELAADAANAGVPMQSPNLRFHIQTPNGSPVLYIDRMTVGVAGGTILVEDTAFDSSKDVNRVTVQLDSLNLADVVALGNMEEVTATGKISGKLPLIFDGDNIIVDTGLLTADGSGVLKMNSDTARRALAGGGAQTELLLDILKNFQYTALSINIEKPKVGDDIVTLHTEGQNPNVENSRPVVLNINLTTDLDKLFNALLKGYRLSEEALRATVKDLKK